MSLPQWDIEGELEHVRQDSAERLERAMLAEAEAAGLRNAIFRIRKAAHFCRSVVWTEAQSDALCDEIMWVVDEVTPNGTPGAEFLKSMDLLHELASEQRAGLIAARGEADELRHELAGMRAKLTTAQQRAAVLEDEAERLRAEVADLRQELKERGNV